MKRDKIKDYNTLDLRIRQIAGNFDDVRGVISDNRKMRFVRVDVEGLRSSGVLKPDETYLPLRIVDSNIRRERARYLQYLTTSRRLIALVNTPPAVAEGDINIVETDFSSKMRYRNWLSPFLRVVDGASLNGWDSVEIVLDVTKPAHICIEHIGSDELIFDTEGHEIQNQDILMRRQYMTIAEVNDAVELYGWNKEQADNLVHSSGASAPAVSAVPGQSESDTRDPLYEVYKVWVKDEDGVVWVAWRSEHCKSFLKSPEKLYIGIDREEIEFPVVMFRYEENEEKEIIRSPGRALLDEFDQAAGSALLTSYINALDRAHNVYASPKQGVPGDSAAPKQIDTVFETGKIFDKPMDFFNTPVPPESALAAIQYITNKNLQDAMHVDWQMMQNTNREKKATEVNAAMAMAASVSSVPLAMFSQFCEELFTKCFEIYSERIIVGDIEVQERVSLTIGALGREYQVAPAGDVDFIEKQGKTAKLIGALQFTQGTSAYPEILKDLLRLSFPIEGQRYVQALDQAQVKNEAIKQLVNVIHSMMFDENGQIEPEFAAHYNELSKVMNQAMQVAQTP